MDKVKIEEAENKIKKVIEESNLTMGEAVAVLEIMKLNLVYCTLGNK